VQDEISGSIVDWRRNHATEISAGRAGVINIREKEIPDATGIILSVTIILSRIAVFAISAY